LEIPLGLESIVELMEREYKNKYTIRKGKYTKSHNVIGRAGGFLDLKPGFCTRGGGDLCFCTAGKCKKQYLGTPLEQNPLLKNRKSPAREPQKPPAYFKR
jgi:hypothetical protein